MYENESQESEQQPTPSLFNVKMLAFIAVGAAGLMLLNGVASTPAPNAGGTLPISMPGLSVPTIPGIGQTPTGLTNKTSQVLDKGLTTADKTIDVVNTGVGVLKVGLDAANVFLSPNTQSTVADPSSTTPTTPSSGGTQP